MNMLRVLTASRKKGNIGERFAARILRKSGYKILKRNFVAAGHEIDIIAKKRDTVCFVEVKTRSEKENPAEPRPASSVGKKKQLSIISAAKIYAAFNTGKYKYLRFDIIEVYLKDGVPNRAEHLVDAYRLDSK